MPVLHLDYETASTVDLDQYGLDRYVKDPSTRVLMAGYAFDEKHPKLWQPHLTPKMPEDLEDALHDPFIEVHAWNAALTNL